MDSRSLFNLILKIIGIFLVRNILEALSRSLSVLVYLPQYSSQKEGFFNLGVTLPPLILYSILAWLLIFRTNNVISALKLDRDINFSRGELRISRSVILTTAVVVAGAWLLINELPEFFRQAVSYYQERRLYRRVIRPDLSYPALSALRILIGLLMIVFCKPIVQLIDRIRTRQDADTGR